MKSFFLAAVRKPVLTILLAVLITAGFATFAAKGFRIETDLNKYMPNDHPAFVYSRQAEEWFGISDGVMIAISNSDGIYNAATLAKIAALSSALENLDGIDGDRIMSLATADNISGSDWGLEVSPFFADIPTSAEEIKSLRKAVESNPMVQDRLVSADGTAALVVARLAAGGSEDLYTRLSELAAGFEGPEEIFIAGRPIVEGALAELGPADMLRMGPIVLIVIAVVLLILLRSFRSAALSMLIVAMSAVWTFGLMALLGIPVYAVSTMIPVMLVAIGVAYSIHVFTNAALHLESFESASPKELADAVISSVGRPVIMTALTTMVGFLSLLTSAVLPVRYFGAFTAFGVFAAMLLALTLIPASFVLFGVPKRSKREGISNRAHRAAGFFSKTIVGKKTIVIIGALAVVVVAAVSIPKVWIDTSFISNFADDSAIVRTDAFVNEKFAGTSALNIVLESPEPDTFRRNDVLGLMDKLQADLETVPAVGDTFSLTDFLKRMNQVIHGEEIEYYVIPDSAEMTAQYLFLYEMSADPETIAQAVDYDYLRSNITVQLKSDSSKVLEVVIDVVEHYRERFEDLGIEVNFAGSAYRAMVFADLILTGQIRSLAVSLLIVMVLLSVMFRSIWMGLIGSIPIIITAIVNFGVMGLLGIPLGISTALISSIAIGIGIDYAIHFIDRYRKQSEAGDNADVAAEKTMYSSGRAILFNAAVVSAGFAVLLISVFPPNRQVGGLTALNMIVSFFGTVTVLLLLLHRSHSKSKYMNSNQNGETK
ncbi:MAG: MMPL family transporter [Spirochaetales bacterium]|jgi:uncharacterized protein|nr:MMPL family transporter [Spirochaetales bacterium]